MTSQGYVKGLKYLIDDSVQYYRICKQKSYTGIMYRINMGCEIFPREKNFWDWQADKTVTVIDRYIYEMTLYDADEARIKAAQVRKTLDDIDYQCDGYRWYEERFSGADGTDGGNGVDLDKRKRKKKELESEWNAEDYAIGVEYLH